MCIDAMLRVARGRENCETRIEHEPPEQDPIAATDSLVYAQVPRAWRIRTGSAIADRKRLYALRCYAWDLAAPP